MRRIVQIDLAQFLDFLNPRSHRVPVRAQRIRGVRDVPAMAQINRQRFLVVGPVGCVVAIQPAKYFGAARA